MEARGEILSLDVLWPLLLSGGVMSVSGGFSLTLLFGLLFPAAAGDIRLHNLLLVLLSGLLGGCLTLIRVGILRKLRLFGLGKSLMIGFNFLNPPGKRWHVEVPAMATTHVAT